MEQVYKLLDQIYCINLISRPDRYAKMKEFELEEKIKINFFRTEKDICSGAIGCFKSHISVISQAYNAGYNQVLVLEDDLIKTSAYSNNIIDFTLIAKFITENKSWEIIQFSWASPVNALFLPMRSSKESKNLSQFGSLLASSYIINRSGMKRILDSYKNYLGFDAVDGYYAEIFKKTMWNVAPMPFYQDRESPNDNVWFHPILDKISIIFDTTFNAGYNLSVLKYYNFCIIFYVILIFLILKKIFNK